MRLSKEEISNLIKGLLQVSIFQSNTLSFSLYCFGSRTDDKKLGGDIDLFLICEDKDRDIFKNNKHHLMAGLKTFIPPQRIDLTIRSKKQLETDEFYQTIKEDMVMVYEQIQP